MADQSAAVEQSATSRQEKPKSKPLSCVEILKTLADVFQYPLTDKALAAYIFTVGHRSEHDLNNAYREVLRYSTKMPTPSELLDACGILLPPRPENRQ